MLLSFSMFGWVEGNFSENVLAKYLELQVCIGSNGEVMRTHVLKGEVF